MQYYYTKTEAGIELFKELKKKLLEIPNVQNQEQMRKIAKPLALNMRKLRPSLVRVFDDRLTMKNSLMMSIISFIGSMVLHALFMWIYHKFKKDKTDLMQLLTPPLTQESNADSSEPTAPFQEALNDVKDHANRIKLEMTMEINNVRAHAFTSQTSYINRDVSKSQPGLHSMNENIVQLKEHYDVYNILRKTPFNNLKSTTLKNCITLKKIITTTFNTFLIQIYSSKCRIFVNIYKLTNGLCVEKEDIKTVPMYFLQKQSAETFRNHSNFFKDGSVTSLNSI